MKTILEVVRDLIKPYIDTNASNIATVEDSTVENPYYVGDQLIYKGVLYNVTADISIGDTLEIGTNISVAPKLSNSIKSALNKLKSDGTSSGTDFNFDIQNGVPGWNSASNRDSSTFHPFSPGSTASDISYDNTTSGLTATDVQAAIDEVDSEKLPTYANDASSWDTTPTKNSTKPVTSDGVKTQLDNINSNKANQSVIATRQAKLTAVKAYVIGEQFIYNNTLYKATATIAKNATITIGGNATTADDISSQISKIATLEKITTATGVQFAYRMGRICFFTFEVVLTNATNGTVICSGLPRPQDVVYCSFMTITGLAVPCILEADGALKIYYPNTTISGRVDGSLMYFIS